MSEPNYIEFGGTNGIGEYLVNVGGYDHKKSIPRSIASQIETLLGKDWAVAHRGSRLEIQSRKFFYGYRNDPVVVGAVKQVIGDLEFLGDVAQLKTFGLPMLLVLDEEESAKSGEIKMVKCAIVSQTEQAWTVKPVEKPYFDPVSGFKNERFDQSHWRISKSDPSAEPIDEEFDVSVLDDYVAEKMRHMLSSMWSPAKK